MQVIKKIDPNHQKRLAHRRDAVLSRKYDSDVDSFKLKMDKWESSPRKRLRDTRNREQCEKGWGRKLEYR